MAVTLAVFSGRPVVWLMSLDMGLEEEIFFLLYSQCLKKCIILCVCHESNLAIHEIDEQCLGLITLN